jgi:hypothetical protein
MFVITNVRNSYVKASVTNKMDAANIMLILRVPLYSLVLIRFILDYNSV